jgi:hypothetical protein
MDDAKRLPPVKARAGVPELVKDGRPLTRREMLWRKVRLRLQPWVIK